MELLALLLLLPRWLQLTGPESEAAFLIHWMVASPFCSDLFVPFREHCECGKPCDKICWIGKNCQRVSQTTVPSPEPQARYFAGVRSSVKSGKLQTCSDMEFRSFCLSVLIKIYDCDQKVSSKTSQVVLPSARSRTEVVQSCSRLALLWAHYSNLSSWVQARQKACWWWRNEKADSGRV